MNIFSEKGFFKLSDFSFLLVYFQPAVE